MWNISTIWNRIWTCRKRDSEKNGPYVCGECISIRLSNSKLPPLQLLYFVIRVYYVITFYHTVSPLLHHLRDSLPPVQFLHKNSASSLLYRCFVLRLPQNKRRNDINQTSVPYSIVTGYMYVIWSNYEAMSLCMMLEMHCQFQTFLLFLYPRLRLNRLNIVPPSSSSSSPMSS